MKRVCVAVLAIIPLSALAVSYPVDLEQQLNGTEVLASTSSMAADMAALHLHNLGAEPVVCSAVFRNGPESPRSRKTALKAGEQKALTAKFTRDVIRLRIQLTCEPQ